MLDIKKAMIEDDKWKRIPSEQGVGENPKLENQIDQLRQDMMFLRIQEENKRK